MANTSSGLDENVAALLSYVLGWITGLIFFLVEKDNQFVRFHAMQSIVFFVAVMIVYTVVGLLPLINVILLPILGILTFIVWIILMIRAYQGQKYKLPVVGDLADKWAGTA